MEKHLAKEFQNLQFYSFGEDYSEIYPDYIDFGVGDPDLCTDQSIIQACYDAALNGATHYDIPQGSIKLRKSICRFYEEEYQLSITPQEVVVTISGCQAMFTVAKALCSLGDEIIIPSPFFASYTHQIELAGGVPVFLETRGEDNFAIDVEKLRALITPKTKAIIVNTPNNPTGACLSKENLREVYDLAVEKDLMVICDDIYTLYSYEEDFFPMMKFDPQLKHVIAINSFSKDFVMTGWRIGTIIAHREIARILAFINETVVYHAPILIQEAAITAIENRKTIQPAIYQEYKHRMFTAYQRLAKLKNVKINPPMGTFYLFPDVSATGLSSGEVARKILEEAHVHVIDGSIFGPGGEGHLRLAVTVPEAKIHEAFDRIEKMDIFR